jgi:hypothetical protein
MEDSNFQSGSPLESMWVHSLAFSYTLMNMKCDYQALISAHIFTSPCLGREPKARVVTSLVVINLFKFNNFVHLLLFM